MQKENLDRPPEYSRNRERRAMKGALITTAFISALALAVTYPTVVEAQPNPLLSGSWILDAKNPGGRGRAGGPPPTRLVIKVTANEVIVDSDTGTNRAIETFNFRPGGPEHEIPGPLSWDTKATSTWDAGRLVVNIRRIIEAPTGPFVIPVRDVYTVSGDMLTIERSQGPQTWTSVFSRQ
jgi:hypothetical protein